MRWFICSLLLLLLAFFGHRNAASQRAADLYAGERHAWVGLADEVARDAESPPSASDFTTGDARFDGEWALVTCQMSIVGLGAVLDRFPDRRPAYLPAMRRCAEQITAEETMAFGNAAWGGPPRRRFRGRAYLGYGALALGVLRRHDPEFACGSEHDAWVDGLAAQPITDLETYPGERYPADQAIVLAAIDAHPDYTVSDATRAELFAQVDRDGLILQGGVGRGSGTFFALAWLGNDQTQPLYDQAHHTLYRPLAGLGAMREYAPGVGGWGDIDSGPLILGRSISATGFALAAARRHHDPDTFAALFNSAYVFGIPRDTRHGWRFTTGGRMGNAILLAMLTAGGD